MKKHFVAFLLFAVLTVLMTYPIAFNVTSSIPGDVGDPLEVIWILSWDVHKILQFDFANLFDANIFYPYKYTLAYSEHMIGSAIFAMPIIAFFKNPVLAYNIIFLMSMTLSGIGMYLLAFYYTGNRLAAFCAGVIFAYFPCRFGHLGHLHFQVAQWIPFTFLYFNKYFETGRYKHLLLFTLFFILQFFSNGYYALFLAFFVTILICIEFYNRGFSNRALFYKLGLFFLLSAIFILPVFYPYIKLKHEMGFTRSLGESTMYSADIFSYLAAPSINRPWGKITSIFLKPEGDIFLGLTAMILAAFGIMRYFKGNHNISLEAINVKSKFVKILSSVMTIFAAIALSEAIIIWLTGGFKFTILGIPVKATKIYKPMSLAFALILLPFFTRYRLRGVINSLFTSRQGFYFIVLVLSFLFSLGPIIHLSGKEIITGPYIFLYKFFPGFDGLRVPARFVIMVALAVSVFAAYGTAGILEHFNAYWKKVAVTGVFSVIILFESASIPIPIPSVPVGNAIPDVYKWLASEKDDFAILELPMPNKPEEVWKETRYLYYSTYHWKKLVNGYSGYFPPAYNFLYMEGMQRIPSDSSVGLLRELGIRYLIIHSADYTTEHFHGTYTDETGNEEWERIKNNLQNYEDVLKPFKQFGNDYVYEIVSKEIDHTRENWKEIPRDKWVLKASAPGTELAIDGKLETRWTPGRPQQPMDFFEIDLGEKRRISGIVLELGSDFVNYPRGYMVESSADGKVWDKIRLENDTVPPLHSFIEQPKAVQFIISFPTVAGRFIKITQLGASQEKYWSISELRIFE